MEELNGLNGQQMLKSNSMVTMKTARVSRVIITAQNRKQVVRQLSTTRAKPGQPLVKQQTEPAFQIHSIIEGGARRPTVKFVTPEQTSLLGSQRQFMQLSRLHDYKDTTVAASKFLIKQRTVPSLHQAASPKLNILSQQQKAAKADSGMPKIRLGLCQQINDIMERSTSLTPMETNPRPSFLEEQTKTMGYNNRTAIREKRNTMKAVPPNHLRLISAKQNDKASSFAAAQQINTTTAVNWVKLSNILTDQGGTTRNRGSKAHPMLPSRNSLSSTVLLAESYPDTEDRLGGQHHLASTFSPVLTSQFRQDSTFSPVLTSQLRQHLNKINHSMEEDTHQAQQTLSKSPTRTTPQVQHQNTFNRQQSAHQIGQRKSNVVLKVPTGGSFLEKNKSKEQQMLHQTVNNLATASYAASIEEQGESSCPSKTIIGQAQQNLCSPKGAVMGLSTQGSFGNAMFSNMRKSHNRKVTKQDSGGVGGSAVNSLNKKVLPPAARAGSTNLISEEKKKSHFTQVNKQKESEYETRLVHKLLEATVSSTAEVGKESVEGHASMPTTFSLSQPAPRHPTANLLSVLETCRAKRNLLQQPTAATTYTKSIQSKALCASPVKGITGISSPQSHQQSLLQAKKNQSQILGKTTAGAWKHHKSVTAKSKQQFITLVGRRLFESNNRGTATQKSLKTQADFHKSPSATAKCPLSDGQNKKLKIEDSAAQKELLQQHEASRSVQKGVDKAVVKVAKQLRESLNKALNSAKKSHGHNLSLKLKEERDRQIAFSPIQARTIQPSFGFLPPDQDNQQSHSNNAAMIQSKIISKSAISLVIPTSQFYDQESPLETRALINKIESPTGALDHEKVKGTAVQLSSPHRLTNRNLTVQPLQTTAGEAILPLDGHLAQHRWGSGHRKLPPNQRNPGEQQQRKSFLFHNVKAASKIVFVKPEEGTPEKEQQDRFQSFSKGVRTLTRPRSASSESSTCFKLDTPMKRFTRVIKEKSSKQSHALSPKSASRLAERNLVCLENYVASKTDNTLESGAETLSLGSQAKMATVDQHQQQRVRRVKQRCTEPESEPADNSAEEAGRTASGKKQHKTTDMDETYNFTRSKSKKKSRKMPRYSSHIQEETSGLCLSGAQYNTEWHQKKSSHQPKQQTTSIEQELSAGQNEQIKDFSLRLLQFAKNQERSRQVEQGTNKLTNSQGGDSIGRSSIKSQPFQALYVKGTNNNNHNASNSRNSRNSTFQHKPKHLSIGQGKSQDADGDKNEVISDTTDQDEDDSEDEETEEYNYDFMAPMTCGRYEDEIIPVVDNKTKQRVAAKKIKIITFDNSKGSELLLKSRSQTLMIQQQHQTTTQHAQSRKQRLTLVTKKRKSTVSRSRGATGGKRKIIVISRSSLNTTKSRGGGKRTRQHASKSSPTRIALRAMESFKRKEIKQ